MNIAKVLLVISALAVLIYAASPKAKLSSEPPATQAAVGARAPTAAPVSLSQEKEDDDDGVEEAREKADSRVSGQKSPTAEVEDDDDDAVSRAGQKAETK